tara:strand:+ start:39 stop:302 length:264 start_codon:yes stop_codon:yes gene_type:complete
MKNLLNKTILKSLQDYKLTNRQTEAVLYLPKSNFQTFLKMNGGRLHNYKFETPAQRKADKIANILDYIVLISAFTAFCLIAYNLITN